MEAADSLPLLRLRDLDSPSTRAGFVAALREACTHPHSGFFFLEVGDRIPQACSSAALRVASQFFALPVEEKLQIDLQESPHYRGFARLGSETTAAITDLREYIELGDERAPVAREGAAAYERMGIGPNQWPAQPPGFRDAMLRYFEAACAVGEEVMGAVSEALELPPGELARRFCAEGAHTRYKPACYRSSSWASAEGVGVEAQSQGLGAHKDFGFLSLLLQNELGGLEVQRASDGVWIAVSCHDIAGIWVAFFSRCQRHRCRQAPPIPGTLVVNLGEMAELVSGGALVASTHRVLPPSGSAPRISIPVFFNPSLSAVVTPVELSESLQACVEARRDAVAMDGTADNRIVPVYGENWVKGFARSQPAWFQRHLPDVYAEQQRLQPVSVRPAL